MVISSCIFCLGYYSLCPVEQAHTKMLHWWSCRKRRVSHPGATGLHVYLTAISTDFKLHHRLPMTVHCLSFLWVLGQIRENHKSRTSQPTQICVNRIALSQLCAFCHCYCACCHFIMHSAAVIVQITVGFLSQCSKINKSFLTLIKAKYFCYGVNPFFSRGRSVFKTSTSPQSL